MKKSAVKKKTYCSHKKSTNLKKMVEMIPQSIIFPHGTGNIISSHLRMCKCLIPIK